MKINSAILAAALGLASAVAANAQNQSGVNYIYFTGSTAARSATYGTLLNSIFDTAPTVISYGDAVNPQNGTYMEFSNTISSTPTILKCHWSGSEAGVADVSGSGSQLFLADLGNNGVPSVTTTAVAAPSGSTNDIHTVDVAQADAALSFSKNPTSTASQTFDNVVIPFIFVKNATSITGEAGLTNINNANFVNLASGGEKLALFTGVEQPTGTTNYVYLSGRDNNSGTRVNVFGITGWGITKLPRQVLLSGSTPNSIVNNTYAPGTGGQSSGGTLAKSMTDSTTSADPIHSSTSSGGFVAVTYLGVADDATAEGAPFNCRRLLYNGVSYSNANIESGYYTLWGNEYTMVKAGEPASVTAFANSVVAGLPVNASLFNDVIPTSSMLVSRTGPNSAVTHN